MRASRREFLQQSLAAGTILMTGASSVARAAYRVAPRPQPDGGGTASNKLKILMLGGTAFLGPAIVRAAVERGHTVTLFNRGKTRPDLFKELEHLHGDRDPKKDEGLKALEGRQWDVAIDTSGQYPRIVKAAADLLAPNLKQYIYISSISAYAKNDKPGADETEPVAKLADETVETMGKSFENYGGLKALCEKAAETAMPGRVANVRPGFIVGPEDYSDRYTYWVVRTAKGGEMLAPGEPSYPMQIIDVRDLGEWLVKLAEDKTMGVFNATGPEKPLTMGGMLEGCKKAAESDAKFTWVPAEFIEKFPEPVDCTIWVPPKGEMAGFHRWSNERAVKAGLKFRSAETTARDTLTWWKSLPEERRAKPRAGMTAEVEAKVLEAWKKEKKA